MRKLSLAGANESQPAEDDQAEAEQQMRQALGLPSSLPRRDKDRTGPGVAVEHRSPRAVPHQNFNRLQQAEEGLAAEQAAHQQAARSLRHAQESLLEFSTKLGHSELALQEAVDARAAIEAALAAERGAREALEQEVAELRLALVAQEKLAQDADPAAEPVRRRRAVPAAAEPEPGEDGEPVQWWVPGWRRSAR